MTDGADLRSITSIAPLVRSGVLSPSTLVRECLKRIEARSSLNAFVTVMKDSALHDAAQAEREISSGRYRSALHGIPISVKDLIAVAGTPTTSGSAVPPLHPAADAPVVRRLRDAGAIVIGKTNLHEFAFGTTSDETAFGAVRHPFDETRSPGGSSGGSAVALADGMCFGSVGTDTGGSIRIPSAACGTVGLKPTLSELPCDGVVPLSTTLDHVGPMARTVADTALLFRAMKGTAAQSIAPAGGRLVFGVPIPFFFDRLDGDVRRLFANTRRALTAAGHSIIDLSIERAAWTPDVYLHIVLPEASCCHATTLDRHAAAYSPGVRLRLEMGGYVLAEDYVRAMRLRDVLTAAVDDAVQRCDALLLPALAIPAPPVGAASVDVDGAREPIRAIMLKLTQLFNVTGHPAVALPAGSGHDGLPRGLQLVGQRGRTERLLDIAAAVELQITAGPGSVGGGTG
jgi:aspartyl-tRNA(Asn)/glutamyl-tRNA(Gln) amidotransferase subunit A